MAQDLHCPEHTAGSMCHCMGSVCTLSRQLVCVRRVMVADLSIIKCPGPLHFSLFRQGPHAGPQQGRVWPKSVTEYQPSSRTQWIE